MEDLILALFIGIPAALVVAAIVAYFRTNRDYQIEGEAEVE